MRYIWLARFGSFFAEHLNESVIALLVWKLTNSELLAAFTIASGRIALWIFGLKAGHVSDYANKARILKFATLITAIASWLMAVLYQLELMVALTLAGLNFIAVASKTFEYAAINTLISGIRDRAEFNKNNIFIDGSKRWARVVSPIVLILLIGLLRTGDLLILVALSYTCVLALYMAATYPSSKGQYQPEKKSVLNIATIKRAVSKEVLALFILFGLYNISYFSAIWILLPNHFSSNNIESDFGWALLSFSIGGLLGNWLYKILLHKRQASITLFLALALVGMACLLFAIDDSLLFISFAASVAGLGLPIMDMTMITIIRSTVPVDSHGIAFSVFRFIADFGLILGGLAGGLLLTYFSHDMAYVMIGSWVFVLLCGAMILRKRHQRPSI